MRKWVEDHSGFAKGRIIAIGTGGNINKLFELSDKVKGELLGYQQLKDTQTMIRNTSLKDRINELQMNPDRADVIIPASEIYISKMESCSRFTGSIQQMKKSFL